MGTEVKKNYETAEIRQIKKAIAEFQGSNHGATRAEIATHLNTLGIPHLSKPKWSMVEVNNFISNHARRKTRKVLKRRRRATLPTVTVTKRKDDRLELATLVLSSHVGDTEKRRMLESLFGVSA